VFVSGTAAAQPAAPRIVIIRGMPLRHQVAISDWGEIADIVGALEASRAAPSTALAHRPRLKVSIFWGPTWDVYLSSGKPAAALRPRQADQLGSFYPAWHARPAMIDLPWSGRWPRLVSVKALAVLKRYGVPIRLA
jgi:hypothetical protein